MNSQIVFAVHRDDSPQALFSTREGAEAFLGAYLDDQEGRAGIMELPLDPMSAEQMKVLRPFYVLMDKDGEITIKEATISNLLDATIVKCGTYSGGVVAASCFAASPAAALERVYPLLLKEREKGEK